MSFSALLATADRAVENILGGAVTYTSGAGAAVNVRGVFDAAYVVVEQGQAAVSSCGPAVFLTLSDLPSDPSDDEEARVTVGSTTYRVREAKPDGLGGVLILLHKA